MWVYSLVTAPRGPLASADNTTDLRLAPLVGRVDLQATCNQLLCVKENDQLTMDLQQDSSAPGCISAECQVGQPTAAVKTQTHCMCRLCQQTVVTACRLGIAAWG